ASASRVDDTLFFLTGDTWHATFVQQPAQPPKAGATVDDASVLLYSGGADGQAGAALADDDPWLVALWDHGGVKGLQRDARRAVDSDDAPCFSQPTARASCRRGHRCRTASPIRRPD